MLSEIDRKIKNIIDSYADNKTCDYSFNEVALEVHKYQYRYNDFYRNYCNQKNINEIIYNWKEIPFFNLESFKGKTIPSCFSYSEDNNMYYETSGTTKGIKGKIFRDNNFFILRSKSIYAQGKRNFFTRYSDKVKIIFLDLANRRNLTNFSEKYSVLNNINYFFGSDLSEFILPNSKMNLDKIIQYIKKSHLKSEPIVIIGPSYHISSLLSYIKTNNIHVIFPSNGLIMDSGGLKNKTDYGNMSDYLMDLFTLFHISRYNYKNTYALSEIGSQFPEYENEIIKEIPPWTKIKIVDQDNNLVFNKNGNIVIYDLLNRTALFGMKTSDIGMEVEKGLIICGRDK